MIPDLKWPIAGVLVAILVTTTMDVTGLTEYSALPLFPLAAGLWFLQRLSRKNVGLTWGQWRHYGLAILYPALVLGAVALIAVAAGATNLSMLNGKKTLINIVVLTVATFLVAILTEEGFFRGWLWASLQRAGQSELGLVIWTSVAFALWHVSWATLSSYSLPVAQVPIFILNAAVIGAIWGLLRRISGSIIVTSLSHGLWNGLAYVLFGLGPKVGALGIVDTAIYGPEVGIVGLVANIAYASALWLWLRRSTRAVRR